MCKVIYWRIGVSEPSDYGTLDFLSLVIGQPLSITFCRRCINTTTLVGVNLLKLPPSLGLGSLRFPLYLIGSVRYLYLRKVFSPMRAYIDVMFIMFVIIEEKSTWTRVRRFIMIMFTIYLMFVLLVQIWYIVTQLR